MNGNLRTLTNYIVNVVISDDIIRLKRTVVIYSEVHYEHYIQYSFTFNIVSMGIYV